jgi:hypothetical protein
MVMVTLRYHLVSTTTEKSITVGNSSGGRLALRLVSNRHHPSSKRRLRMGLERPSQILAVATTVLILIGIFCVFGSLFGTTNENAQATVTSSTQYVAGTMIDGQTYNLIGYNITFTYDGAVGHTTITCPLYPVGSKVSAQYVNFLWLLPYLRIGTLPAGCSQS